MKKNKGKKATAVCLASLMLTTHFLIATTYAQASDIPQLQASFDEPMQGAFSLLDITESPIDTFMRLNTAVDMSNALITSDFDAYGNLFYTIETQARSERFNFQRLSELAQPILDDPEIEASFSNNVLTYTLSNGVVGRMTETVYPDGSISIHTIEGDIESVMFMNFATGELNIDGVVTKLMVNETFVIYQNARWTQPHEWRFLSSHNVDIAFERALRTYAVSTIVSVVGMTNLATRAFQILTVGGAAIRGAFELYNWNGTTLFARRRSYAGNFETRLVDSFYTNSARTNHAHTRTRTFME